MTPALRVLDTMRNRFGALAACVMLVWAHVSPAQAGVVPPERAGRPDGTLVDQIKTKPKPAPKPAPEPTPREAQPAPPAAPVLALPPEPEPIPQPQLPENVEADVSTHTVSITSSFKGTDIVVFGSVANSRQPSAESGYYDVVVLIEGARAPSIVRVKDSFGGLWLNTRPVRFDNLPLYSAIASTRPIEEIAEPFVRAASGIGFARARMLPGKGSAKMSPEEIDTYKSAILRLKQKDGLYVSYDYGVAFIGRSLFRASVKLPANIPVGPLVARVLLFQGGTLLSTQSATVMLQRDGLERLIYDFAYENPVWYGIFAVLSAAAFGLAASAMFTRPSG